MSSGKRKNKIREEAVKYFSSEDLLVLDTHVWIWLEEGHERLRASKAFSVLQEAASYAHLRISPISIWEVSMLEAKGRIHLSFNSFEWVQNALKNPRISLLPLSAETAWEAGRLPGDFHGDPCDRLLIATVRQLRAKLVTADKRILEYAKQNYVKIVPV